MEDTDFMYARPYLGMTGVNLGLNYASALLSTSGNAFGISWSNFSSSGQYAENTFCFSYSHMVSRGLFTGFNMKYMGHSFTTDADTRNDPVFDGGLSSKYGFESDVGVLLKLDDKFAIGAAGKNLLQADMGLLDPDVTEREIRGGAALYPSDNITAALDVGYRAEKLLISCGGEAWLPDGKIGLRGGANMREGSLCEITFGASYKERMGNDKALRIDYCFVYPVSIAGFVTSHRVAVSMEF